MAHRGRRAHLKGAFTNLLSNAVKCTESGSVTLRVHFDRQGPSDAQLAATVADTGGGLTTHGLAQTMAPFGQIRTGNGAQQGTDLGLPLTREMIETGHGGSLKLASDGLETGATATTVVPLKWKEAPGSPPPVASLLRGSHSTPL